MKTQRFFGLLFFLLFLLCCAQTSTTVVYNLKGKIDDKECVAILPFDNLTDAPKAGRVISDFMGTAFFRSGKFRVMERSEIERIATFSKVTLPKQISPNFARTLGEVLGVDAVLIGSVSEYAYMDSDLGNPSVAIKANLIDVVTGESLWLASHSRTSKDFLQYKKDPINRVAFLGIDQITEPFFGKVPKRDLDYRKICGNGEVILSPPAPGVRDEPRFTLGTLVGRTVRKNGTALGSVVLEFPNRNLSRILTDKETGSFKIDNVPPGMIRIRATKRGYDPQIFDTEIQSDRISIVDLELDRAVREKRRKTGRISGRVLDTKGNAIPAVVFLKSKKRNVDLKTNTNNKGKFKMSVPPGRYQLRFVAKGYITQSKIINVEHKSKVILNINMHSGRGS